jgi:hypothetical protein
MSTPTQTNEVIVYLILIAVIVVLFCVFKEDK